MSRLLVISHTPHYLLKDGSIVGWGATVQELDCLAEAFGELEHLAPLYREPAPKSALSYKSPHVQLNLLRPSGGKKIRDKLEIVMNYPLYLNAIHKAVLRADVIQIRCPCNIAIAALLYLAGDKTPLRWAKYAGNWIENHPPFSYRLQRWLLTRGYHGGPVTINGKWPGQPAHVYSFYNPCLTSSELHQARYVASAKRLEGPIQLLFVGRVEEAKGVGCALETLAGLREKGLACLLGIVGDGSGRERFKKRALELRIDDVTLFHGWMSRDALSKMYAQAHFLILPTYASEGFPKVLGEAMAYGVVPLAGAVSSIPQLLAESGTGVALAPENHELFVMAIQNYLQHPEKWRSSISAGLKAAVHFTYERYLVELDRMFCNVWGTSPIKVEIS